MSTSKLTTTAESNSDSMDSSDATAENKRRVETTEIAVLEQPPPEEEDAPSYSFVQRQAMRIARWPKTYFWISFFISFGLSAFGMIVGEFSVSNEEGGWQSRGTMIADRTTQIFMVTLNQKELFYGGTAVWDDYTNNVQIGWESTGEDDRRRLEEGVSSTATTSKSWLQQAIPSFSGPGGSSINLRQGLPLAHENQVLKKFLQRKLKEDSSRRLEGCSEEQLGIYTDGNMTRQQRLWPVWKTKRDDDSALNSSLVEEICISEEQTQRVLEENGLCITCDGTVAAQGAVGTCLPPYSIVLYARVLVEGGMDLDCASLAQAWGPYQAQTEAEWKGCVDYIEANPTTVESGEFLLHCPKFFHPSIVDEFFDTTGLVQYTSSVFATNNDMIEDMYELVDKFGKGGDEVEGAYDTQSEEFLSIFADGAVGRDMLLACGSAFITTIAIIVHTRSLFLTLVGVVQIILSFPLAFFAYRFLGGFNFFPFLNFIGVFVVFALGADHVFVAVDKWKNARLDHPNATTEQIAARALPDAASAMLLTTSTTAAAFFGTAICPVAPVRLFALFCGMLIVFDYVMDVALIFPALCIYDGYRANPNCCITCCAGRNDKGADDDEGEGEEVRKSGKDGSGVERTQELEQTQELGISDADQTAAAVEEKPMRVSLIRRILLGYYNLLHTARWALLVACIAALCISAVYAFKLSLPTSADVRIVTESIEFEKNYQWRQNLLSEVVQKAGGSLAAIAWGVTPADTGDHNDPASWSQLVLDESFDPSTTEAQEYLKNYCPKFFSAEDPESGELFAGLPYEGFQCSMNKFDDWLQQESAAMTANGTASEIYEENCNGATQLPMDSDAFHPCMVAWSKAEEEYNVLSRDGVVEIIIFSFNSRVRYDSPAKELDYEWNLIEDWMVDQSENGPPEAANAFFSSQDFWWHDTNLQMFRTAYGSAAIAIAASAVVILVSSRSLVMTLFSVLSIAYVLGSVTSMMVAAGWSLGFLESICFAILIGVSVDFVIHFSHAYVHMPGKVARDVRTKHALIDMGPSILAAAFTTMAGAMIMLFCVITFFTKFAFVLFFAIVQATIGSFVFFLTLTDCIGPEEPTHMADLVVKQCKGEIAEPEGAADTVERSSSNKGGVVPAAHVPPTFSLLSTLSEEIEV